MTADGDTKGSIEIKNVMQYLSFYLYNKKYIKLHRVGNSAQVHYSAQNNKWDFKWYALH